MASRDGGQAHAPDEAQADAQAARKPGQSVTAQQLAAAQVVDRHQVCVTQGMGLHVSYFQQKRYFALYRGLDAGKQSRALPLIKHISCCG